MNIEKNKIQSALKKLEALTHWKFSCKMLENKAFDAKVEILLPSKTIAKNVEYKPSFQNALLDYYIDKFKEQNILLISNYFSEKTAEKLRENNIAYLDQAGNAFFQEANEIFILVKGNKAPKIEKSPKNRLFQASGLKFLFYILQKPEIIHLKQREIQEITALSLGTINILLNNLKEADYLYEYANKKQLNNYPKLLERWLIGYEEVLKPSLNPQKYKLVTSSLSESWQTLDLKNNQAFWGGEPAGDLLTNYLTPEKFTIYTYQPRIELMKNLKIMPQPEGNLEVLDCFWKNSYLIDNQTLTVPPLLVYADLMLSGNSRNIETAQRIYEKYLSNFN